MAQQKRMKGDHALLLLSVVLLVVALMSLFSCSVFKPKEECKDVCDGDMQFSSGDVSLGGFSYDMGDNTSLNGHCGFHYVDGAVGGYGNTLEFQSEECGVHLTWAFYRLLEYEFSRNWRGKVAPSGLRMGDSAARFRQLYPGCGVMCDSTVYWVKTTVHSYNDIFNDVYLVACVDVAGAIDSLAVTGFWWEPDERYECPHHTGK